MVLRRLATSLAFAGMDILRLQRSIRGIPAFVRSFNAYRECQDETFPAKLNQLLPVLNESNLPAGTARGHYFYQDLWAARKVYVRQPSSHLDVGSRIDGFVAHLLTFMPVSVVDVRSLESSVPGLTFTRADARNLTGIATDSVVSVSSLHAIEHFGLGRYGDQVDPSAPRKAVRSLARVLAPGGMLYLSVPVGQQRLEFNAHRVFSPHTITGWLPDLTLESFALVTDADEFVEDARLEDGTAARYACGLFEFSKPH